MVQKITCPKCGKEFAPEEGYKKHLEALEKKAVKDADKKNKAILNMPKIRIIIL